MDDPELYKPETSLRIEESSVTTEDAANNNNNDGVPVQIKQNTQRSTWPRYSVLLAEHPYAVFFFMLVLIIICGLASFLPQFNAPDFPDFSTPVMGFEPRGTKINTRYRTSLLLGKAANLGLVATSPFSELNSTCNISMDLPNVNAIFLTPKTKMNRTRRHAKKNFHLVMCDSPNVFMKSKISYKMVFASTISGNDIFNARSLKAVCRMEEKLMRKAPGFNLNCFKKNTRYDTGRVVECCPSWSVGNYIAALSKKSSCKDISSADVLNVFSLLRQCAPFFNNASLKENCWDFKYKTVYPVCRSLPLRCVRYNAVHNIMYYLTDKHFLGPNGEKLTYTSVLIPAIRDKPYRNHIYETYLKKGDVSDGSVKLVGTDFYSLKFDMFNTMLLADIIYPSIALMIILLIMWFYTESVLITFLLMFSVISALIIAYFLYMIVFGLKFFPFLNITTLIFLVGIGADDAFVFSDVWRQSKLNNPGATLARITAETLKHASLSMFVTSFTTAAAFIANFSSQITTIKCFGIYAGIAILCKFSMMVTWFPAVSVINEKLCVPWSCNKRFTWQTMRNFYERYVGYFVRYFFEQFLPHIVIKFRFFWIALFSVLTLGGLEILLFKPGFRLPTSSDFQMFEASHPLEVYELNLKENFRFETSPSHGSATFLIAVFWGLKAIDNGNQLNPYDYGTLEWDKSFNVTKSESQKWLLRFCRRLRRQGFYAKKEGEASYCFLEKYYNQSCHDPLTPNISYYPCCRDMPFPFNKTVLDLCAVKASVRAHLLKFKRHDSTIGSFIYDKQGNIKGVHMSIYSNVPLSRAYQPAHQFYERIESWLKRETSTAPDGMKRAWWTSNLEFYDLQKSLSSGTLVSMAIAIAMAFAVMLLTTLNVLVSVYAILTIIGIISVTTGALVLSGWKLNILESITMSVAVGVSIDFAMHFGVAYCLAPNKECRKARVRFSLSRMGSAITMAAVTTFIAGAMMMPSRVLSYLQMGHFLMLVMTLGWAFSTFFFQALCCTIGPEGDWGQFSWRSILSCCCKRVSDKAQPKEKMELLQYNCETCENELESNDLVVKSVGFKSVKTTAV